MTITYDFEDPAYFDLADVRNEMDRVFDLCHGCRLCLPLCPSFKSMFDLIDAKTDGIHVDLPPADQDRIVDECYQCKLCYIKCPYIPPHEWQLDFPKLMLRAAAARSGGKPPTFGDRMLSATDFAGKAATATAFLANPSMKANGPVRKVMQKAFGISAQRVLPPYAKQRFSTWWAKEGYSEPVRPYVASESAGPAPAAAASGAKPSFLEPSEDELAAVRPGLPTAEPKAAVPSFLEPSEDELAAMSARPVPEGGDLGASAKPAADKAPAAEPAEVPRKVTLFATCIVEYQDPEIGKATVRVLRHNGCDVACADGVKCCGMPRLDAADIDAFVEQAKDNVAALLPEVRAGRLIVVPQPTCNYTLRKEYPAYLKTPEADEVAAAVVDPAEYLVRLSKGEGIATDFTTELGSVAYHAACHLRVQQQGYKARDLLKQVPGTDVTVVEGCTGIDGTWGYREKNVELAKKVMAPTAEGMRKAKADLLVGDCLLSDQAFTEEGLDKPIHPMQALARAYGLDDGTESR